MPRLIFLLSFLCLPFSLHSITLAPLNNILSQQQKSIASSIELTSLKKAPDDDPGPQKQKNINPLQLAQSPFQQVPVSNTELNLAENTENPGEFAQHQEQQLIQAIKDWAKAWSKKNYKNYINAYTHTYKGRKSNHRDWVEYIRTRLQQTGKIDININNIYIKSRSAQRAIIDFEQAYKSPTYRDKIIKRIVLTKEKNHWKISEERTLKVL